MEAYISRVLFVSMQHNTSEIVLSCILQRELQILAY